MLLDFVTRYAQECIHASGLLGVGILMALESIVTPVPSEAVMPLVGFEVYEGKFHLAPALFAACLGSLIGSLASYYLGYFGGKKWVLRVGKWFLVSEHHLDLTTYWFEKHGGITVFISRFVPVVRHFISVPAGMGKMPIMRFCLFTLLGATIWNSLLLYLGYSLKRNWKTVEHYSHYADMTFIAGGIVALVVWIYLMRKRPAKAFADVPERTV